MKEIMKNTEKEDQTTLQQTINELTAIQKLMNKYVPLSRTDLNGNITYINDAMCNISGYSTDELLGKNHRVLRHPAEPKETFEELWRCIAQGENWEGELRSRRKDGSTFWVKVHIHPLHDQNNDIIGYQSLREDITYRKELEFIAANDKLTGIYNRRKFDELLHLELDRTKRYNETFSLILCDVDCFKKVNDTYGHLIGDQVLVKITESIKQSIRLSDVLARWGGEEFVILLPHTTQEDAGIVAEKIRRGIETTLFESVGKMTISCGVSQVQIGDDRSTFFQRVDSALYQAKKRGRNCIVRN